MGRLDDIERLKNLRGGVHPCKLNKLSKSGFLGVENHSISNIDCEIASTVCARYYKGIAAHLDNIVLEVPEDKGSGEMEERFFKQAEETFLQNDCKPGDTINAFNKTVDKSGVSPTLTTRPEGFKTAILPVVDGEKEEPKKKKKVYRIRKLTPKECFRLQDVTDQDADKMLAVNSNSQCYKQAGNSICVSCLIALFSQLNIKGVKTWNEGLYKDMGY